jgi:hypothetical protein
VATVAENLSTALDNLTAAYAAAVVSPKPSYSEGGRSVSWTEYLESLTRQIQTIKTLLGQAAPIEVVTRIIPR